MLAKPHATAPVKFCSKFIYLFFGYFDIFDNKINNFRGDLSDISAKTATLTSTFESSNSTVTVRYTVRYPVSSASFLTELSVSSP